MSKNIELEVILSKARDLLFKTPYTNIISPRLLNLLSEYYNTVSLPHMNDYYDNDVKIYTTNYKGNVSILTNSYFNDFLLASKINFDWIENHNSINSEFDYTLKLYLDDVVVYCPIIALYDGCEDYAYYVIVDMRTPNLNLSLSI